MLTIINTDYSVLRQFCNRTFPNLQAKSESREMVLSQDSLCHFSLLFGSVSAKLWVRASGRWKDRICLVWRSQTTWLGEFSDPLQNISLDTEEQWQWGRLHKYSERVHILSFESSPKHTFLLLFPPRFSWRSAYCPFEILLPVPQSGGSYFESLPQTWWRYHQLTHWELERSKINKRWSQAT